MKISVFRKFLGLLLCIVFSLSAFAQNDGTDSYVAPKTDANADKRPRKRPSTKSFTDQLKYGGSFGAYFGQTSYVELAPKVGYKVTDKLFAGVGFNYIYFSTKYYGQRFVSHIYGPSFFAQYVIYNGLFAYGEFNAYNIALQNPFTYAQERTWIGSAPVGLGFYSGGQLGGVYLAVLYDLINNENSPYYNPNMPIILRVGFFF